MFVPESRSQRNFPSNSYQQTLGKSSSGEWLYANLYGVSKEESVASIIPSLRARAKLLRTQDDDILDYNNIYLKLKLRKQR